MGNVYVLENEPFLTHFIREYLSEAGHEMIEKSGYNEIMESLEKGKGMPELILVDRTNGMKGEDICYSIKEQNYRIPVIPIIDNEHCTREVNNSCGHDCNGYINVPFTRSKFMEKINEIFSGEDIRRDISEFIPY